MIRDPQPQDILPLIVQYLKEVGLKKSAKQIDALYEHDETPLEGKSLQRIIKHYIKNHNSLAQQFQQEEEEVVEEEVEEEVEEVAEEKEEEENKDKKQNTNGLLKHNISKQEQQPKQVKKKFFQKCDDSIFDRIPTPLRDNTHEAKKKFGGTGDEFGEFGNEKLRQTRGDSFKKEKGKLKNRQFQGMGSINTNVINGVKLL